MWVRFFVWLTAGAIVVVLIYRDLANRKHAPATGSNGSNDVSPTTIDASVAPPADAITVEPSVVVDAGTPADAEQVAIDAPPPVSLYAVSEALDDVASGKLEFIGTGAWFGNFSIHACAYRNARVIVVNEYCTVKEQPALGLTVLSPTRGRMKIYAEGNAAISTLDRSGYFTFRVEVQPPLEDDPITLAITYDELNAWAERRYNSRAGECWYGDDAGCSGSLSPQPWDESTKEFLDEPPATWFALVKDLHARAIRDSRRK